ncbi:hypothetical protein [[Mycobacterium] wendilense]|uniref:Uncharacterized protein n=1 Tax=[Mycobacterium] wendilense TaxID=3064284 RepID=A0ABN9P5C4_9MYCO|nr:hypothetical protein [Mycolicibacterium sp. MU0050]CAJ1587277.1 hypothetical protein MU0050_004710 [Mycolicibacterium sp. MU0050]
MLTVDLAGSSTPSPTITDHIRPGMPNENGESTGSFLYTSPDGRPPTIGADYNQELGTVEWDWAQETTSSVRVHYTHTRNPDYDGPPTIDTVVMTVEGIDDPVTFDVQIAAAGQPAELSVIDSWSWETDPSDGSVRGSIIVKGAEDPRELRWLGRSSEWGDRVDFDLDNVNRVDENTWEVGITYVPSQETLERATQTPGGLAVHLHVTAAGRYGHSDLTIPVNLRPAEDSASPITDHIQPGAPDQNGVATGSFLYTGADGEGLSFDYSELEHGGAVEFDIQLEAEGWRVHYTYTPDREFAHSLAHVDYQGGSVTEAFAITVTEADGTILPALDVEVPVTPVNTAPMVASPQEAVLLGVISPDLSIHLRMVVWFDDPDGDEFEVVEVTAASGRDVHLLGVEEVGGPPPHPKPSTTLPATRMR